jgi:hypothetical protein
LASFLKEAKETLKDNTSLKTPNYHVPRFHNRADSASQKINSHLTCNNMKEDSAIDHLTVETKFQNALVVSKLAPSWLTHEFNS